MSDHDHGMDPSDVLSDGEYFIDAAQYLSDHDAISESEQIEYVGDLAAAGIPFFSPKNEYVSDCILSLYSTFKLTVFCYFDNFVTL